MKYIFSFSITWLLCLYAIPHVYAQTDALVQGKITDKQTQKTLAWANVVYVGQNTGTQADEAGNFQLTWHKGLPQRIVATFAGYKADTLSVDLQKPMLIALQAQATLSEVEVKAHQCMEREVQNTEILTTKDLKKAACCNLSESFETQNSVDVQVADAVSGTKQIKMLGLDGAYSQIMVENMPTIRGLNAKAGMTYLPGTWIQSIEINKGAGSVANGYESITGQINVELIKPEKSEKMLLNLFLGDWGRIETNLNLRQKINEKWSTGLLLHASTLPMVQDNNKDGFMDLPQYQQINALNRWKYAGEKVEAQFGIQGLIDQRLGGQNDFKRTQARTTQLPYGFWTNDRQMDMFVKVGFFLPKEASIGIISHLTHHNKQAAWGLNDYKGVQNYALLQVLYDAPQGKNRRLRMGLNFVSDSYKEQYQQNIPTNHRFDRQRQELNAGYFVEYRWQWLQKWQLIAGVRQDFHNLMGTFITPRLHAKYDITPNTVLRLSAGRGQRIANVLVENMPLLMSSRSLEIAPNLAPEIAYNYGASLSHRLFLGERPLNLSIEYFRTNFQNQIITDLDFSPQHIRIYNLTHKSWANSLQAEAKMEILRDIEILLSYKWYEVRTSIITTADIAQANNFRTILAPFVPQQRALLNVGYNSKHSPWKADATLQYWGRKRLPNTQANPLMHQMPDYSPHFWILNTQLTYQWKRLEWYVGTENLLNMRQEVPIIDAQNPFSEHFDAGIVWGPIMGRMLYTGIRWSLP